MIKYGNYYYNYPYRHEHYQFIGKGNASNVKTTYKHVTKSGNTYSINYSTNNKGFRIPFDIDISKPSPLSFFKIRKLLQENNFVRFGFFFFGFRNLGA